MGFFHVLASTKKNWTSQIPQNMILQKLMCKTLVPSFFVLFAFPDLWLLEIFRPGEAAAKKEGTGGEDGRNARIRVRGV